MTREEKKAMDAMREEIKRLKAPGPLRRAWRAFSRKCKQTCIDEFFWGAMVMAAALYAAHEIFGWINVCG